MNRTFRIVLACIAGAGIGSILAIKFNTLFWIGLIFGSFCAYLIVDFEEFVLTIKKQAKIEYNFDKKLILRKLQLLYACFVIFVKFNSLLIALYVSIYFDLGFIAMLLILTILSIFILYFLSSIFFGGFFGNSAKVEESFEEIEFLMTGPGPIRFNLIIMPVFILNIVGYIFILPFIVLAPVARIIKRTLCQIHNHDRLAVMFDSFVGASVGWYFVQPLAGMFIAGILGLIYVKIPTDIRRKIELYG